MKKNAKEIMLFSVLIGIVMFYFAHRVTLIYVTLEGAWLTRLNLATDLVFGEIQRQWWNGAFTLLSLQMGALAFVTTLLVGLYIVAGQKNRRPGEEYGSARWGTARDSAPFKDKDPRQNIILTETEQLSMSGRMKDPEYDRNKNVVVIGGAGSRKTRGYVKPNLAQLNASYVVTESKGLLPHETGKLFVEAGYRFKVFDLVNRENCDYFNPFVYMKKEDHVLMVADNFLKNTDGNIQKTGDPFWDKAEKALYCAIFSYLKAEGLPEEQTFDMVGELVRASRIEGEDDQMVSPLDILFEEFGEDNPNHFAKKQYDIFKLATPKTARSILLCAGVRLSPFDIPSIARLTSKDTLELDTLGDEPTVLFVCLPDTFESFNFLAAMMYQLLFETLANKADHTQKGRLTLNVRCILDEFANIGQIPNFDRLISVLRSRGVSIDIILQTLSQLKHMYKDTWETILGSCDSLLYLGGMEKSTHKYMSELCEKETIDVTDYSTTHGTQGSYSKQHKKQGRELITTGEVASLKNTECLLKIRGVPPFKSKKYDLAKHKNYRYFSDYHEDNWYEYSIGQSPMESFLKNVKTVEVVELNEEVA